MSFATFIPNLWHARILSNLNNLHVYAQGFNREYEGEIKGQGSSVTINSIGRITISTYTRNTDLAAPEELDFASQQMTITEADSYHFYVDSIDKVQAKGDGMTEASKEAAWGIANEVDGFLSAKLAADAGLSVTAATIGLGAGEYSPVDVFEEMSVALDETNTPGGDRWLFIPPWMRGILRLDERYSSFGTDKSNARLRGEPIGEASGFKIYVSNQVPRDGSEYVILGGYKGAATYAEQLVETKAYEPERRFGDAMKGLHVYGAAVTRPSNIVRFDATRGTFRA